MELSKLYLLISNSLAYKLSNKYPNLSNIEMYYGIADTRMIVHLHDINNMAELFTAVDEIDFAIRTKESISKVEILSQLPEGVDTKDKLEI